MTRFHVIVAACALLLLAVCGTTGEAAASAAPGATLLLSRPSGLGALPSAGTNNSFVSPGQALSEDGRYVAFESKSDALSADDDNRFNNVFVRDLSTGTITLISRSTAGEAANGDSFDPAISADGQHVVFTSAATNLASDDGNGAPDVYVRDLDTGVTALVSRAEGTNAPGNAGSSEGSISSDGRRIAFSSTASNLADDANHTSDVFLRVRGAFPHTSLISRASGDSGATGGTAESSQPSITPDGMKVAFATRAAFNATVDANGLTDVYLRDVAASPDTTTLISRAAGVNGAGGDGASTRPSIDEAGTRVAFASTAANLADGDTTHTKDVHVRDTGAGTTLLVSAGMVQPSGNRDSDLPSIDFVGTRVVFHSFADDLDGGVADSVHVRDLASPHTRPVSAGPPPAGGSVTALNGSISGDGSAAAFTAADDALRAQGAGDFKQVFAVPTTGPVSFSQLVSRPTGTAPQRGEVNASFIPGPRAVSADGRYVVFISDSDSFSASDDDSAQQVFRRDLVTGETVLVSRGGNHGPAQDGHIIGVSTSADGNRVVFATNASNLVEGDTNNAEDVFVRDIAADTTRRVSRGDGATGAQGNDLSFDPVISADGGRVAFVSDADNLTPDDGDFVRDVFLRDLSSNTTTLISTGAGGKGDSTSEHPSIDSSGTHVAFQSMAANLSDAHQTLGLDVYLRDVHAGTTQLVSRASGAGPGGDLDSWEPDLSGDGTRVAFTSWADNLDGGNPSTQDIFVRDTAADTTTLVSRADGSAGAAADGQSELAAISADGRRVAFSSNAGNLEGGGPGEDVFLRDVADGSTSLVSGGTGGQPADGDSFDPSLSASGTCVAFDSRATNLVADGYGSPDHSQVYLRAIDGECPPSAAESRSGGGSADGAGGGAGTGTGTDTTAPLLDRLALSNKRFRVARQATPVAARTKTGTRISWRLSEAATVTIAVERAQPGRRKGRRCVRPSRKLSKAKRCTRFVAAGHLTRKSTAGVNALAFSGRIGRKALKPAKYRAVLTAVDAAGNNSTPRTVTFQIVRR